METIKTYIKGLFEHPKTTLSGAIVLSGVGIYLAGYISQEQLMVALGVLVGYGLVSGADAKKDAQ